MEPAEPSWTDHRLGRAKKVGYAICNKLKRSADLKDIPLILTSSDEVPAKFEQHKTFKLRADEYIFKPFDSDELCRKVDKLVGLGVPVSATTDEAFLNSDLLSSEIAIEADDIVDESHIPTRHQPRPMRQAVGGSWKWKQRQTSRRDGRPGLDSSTKKLRRLSTLSRFTCRLR